MKRHAYLQQCAALCQQGLVSPSKGIVPWQQDQSGPLDVHRDQVFGQPFQGFGKLQIADKLAFSASALVFGALPGCDGESIGISMGTVCGSLSTDIRYMESVAAGFPRPACFSATLPSSPVAEVAIQFKIKGPNRVVAGGMCPGLCALDCALSIIARDKAQGMLVLSVGAIDPRDTASPLVVPKGDMEAYSYALLVTGAPCEGGLNRRIVLDGEFSPAGMAAQRKESYFLDIVTKSQMRCESLRIDLRPWGFEGYLSIEKDS